MIVLEAGVCTDADNICTRFKARIRLDEINANQVTREKVEKTKN